MNVPIDMSRDELIDRYLNGKLDSAATTQFEIALLDDPALLEQVQLAAAMKEALRSHGSLSATGTAAGTKVDTKSGGNEHSRSAVILPFAHWLRQPLSLAASLLVTVLALHAMVNTLPDAPASDAATDSTASGTLRITSVFVLEQTRSTQATRFTGAPPYLLQIDAGLTAASTDFDFVLMDAAGNELLRETDIRADADGWVRLVLGAPLRGDYQVALNPVQAAAGNVSRFSFSVD